MRPYLLYYAFGIKPRIFISNSFKNWDPYVRAKYKTIPELYQGAEKLLFQISNSTTYICEVPIVFDQNKNDKSNFDPLNMQQLWVFELLIRKYIYFYNIRVKMTTEMNF